MIVRDKEIAKSIFLEANLTCDKNKNNYSINQFEMAWDNWTGFYVQPGKCFAGIRRYGPKLRRIFDRYFVYPEVRSSNLQHKQYANDILNEMLYNCDGIPFFSIEKQKTAIIKAVNTFNETLNDDYYEVLEDKYFTADKSHQWIAVKKKHIMEIESTLV